MNEPTWAEIKRTWAGRTGLKEITSMIERAVAPLRADINRLERELARLRSAQSQPQPPRPPASPPQTE